MAQPVDTALYDLLRVSPTATAAELKTAYRAQALRMHPDKGGDPEQFKTMKGAYDVLSDPKRRETYDKYGPEVLRMMQGNVGSPSDVWKALSRVGKRERAVALLVLLSFVGAVLSPTILMSLKWDSQLNCHWSVVFAPLWVLQAAALVFLLRCMDVPPPKEDEADWDDEAKAMYKEQKAQMLVTKLSSGFVIVLYMLLQLFVALQLEGAISWSWFCVLLPWATLEVYFLVWRIVGARSTWAMADPKAAMEATLLGGSGHSVKFYKFLAAQLGWGLVRIATFVLVAARADGRFKGSWFLCLIPAIVAGSLVVASAWARDREGKLKSDQESQDRTASLEEGQAAPNEEVATQDETCTACCSVGFWLFMLCVAAGKMDGGKYSAFLVFLPIFIVACCVTCVFGCVVVGLSPDVVDSMERESAVREEERRRVNQENYGGTEPSGSAGNPSARSH